METPYWLSREVSRSVARDCSGNVAEFSARAAQARELHGDGMDDLRQLMSLLAEQVITGCRIRHQYMPQNAVAEFTRLASEAWHAATGKPLPERDDEMCCFAGPGEPNGSQLASVERYRAWKKMDREGREARWREHLAK